MIFILSDSHSGVLSLSRFFFDFSTIKENLLTLENVLRNKTVWGFFFKRRFDRNCSQIFVLTEAVVQRCSAKKMSLKISQNSLENICARVPFLIKL